MAATLSGVEFYKVKGYTELERIAVPLPHGEALPVVRMGKYVWRNLVCLALTRCGTNASKVDAHT